MADNQLLRLSHHFATLTSLRLLRLSGNNLKKLPAEIGSLQSLTFMDACHNSLNKLPAEIGACTALQHLNMSFNKSVLLEPTPDLLCPWRCVGLGLVRWTRVAFVVAWF